MESNLSVFIDRSYRQTCLWTYFRSVLISCEDTFGGEGKGLCLYVVTEKDSVSVCGGGYFIYKVCLVSIIQVVFWRYSFRIIVKVGGKFYLAPWRHLDELRLRCYPLWKLFSIVVFTEGESVLLCDTLRSRKRIFNYTLLKPETNLWLSRFCIWRLFAVA